MKCCSGTAVAVAILIVPVAVWAQHSHRPQASNPPAEPSPTGTVSPELERLSRAVAIQARPDQVGYFYSIIDSTDAALQQSRDLQQLGAAATNIPIVNAKSLQLRDVLDDIDLYNRRFLASFTKLQESELKTLRKRVRKSYTYVDKESTQVAQRMEPGKVVPERLASAAANLEKALSDFRTDEIRLGREMGIQSK
ncbi:MAG TPA: hypothetical protein VMU45_05115 [Candidatus Eisenbacteria bacterium]|nr:hypothetical protein [Candidatus Eisenbacteria bacterium]